MSAVICNESKVLGHIWFWCSNINRSLINLGTMRLSQNQLPVVPLGIHRYIILSLQNKSYYNWSLLGICLFRIYSVVYGPTDPILE